MKTVGMFPISQFPFSDARSPIKGLNAPHFLPFVSYFPFFPPSLICERRGLLDPMMSASDLLQSARRGRSSRRPVDRNTKSKKAVAYLSEEIVENILLWLPVKSLIRLWKRFTSCHWFPISHSFPPSFICERGLLDPMMSASDFLQSARRGRSSRRSVDRNKKSKKAAAYLPEEIVENILLWLPVKSLIRFRCVRKSWCRLIGSTSFIDNHLRVHPNRNRKLVISDRREFFYGLSAGHWDRLDSPSIAPTNSSYGTWLVGHANGIICFVLWDDIIVLWNPATREYKVLPQFSIPDSSCKTNITKQRCYFGFDSTTCDYYVLRVVMLRRLTHHRVELYSLKSDSWREIPGGIPYHYGETSNSPHSEAFSYNLFGGKVNASCEIGCVGGFFFWCFKKPTEPDSQGIVLFDIAKEEIKYLQFPEHLATRTSWNATSFKESIAIIGEIRGTFRCSSDALVEVWVMEQFGNPESWVKHVSVEFTDVVFRAFISTQEFLLEDTRRSILLIRCPSTQKFFDTCCAPPSFSLRCLNYTESLVSLGGQSVIQTHPSLSKVDAGVARLEGPSGLPQGRPKRKTRRPSRLLD